MRTASKLLDRDLSLPLDIDSERWAILSSGVMRLGCVVFACIILIAAIAPIREFSIASGQLTTTQSQAIIEHYDGGRIEEILVRQGDFVELGTPILKLDRESVHSELVQLQSRQAHQQLQRERIFAHIENREPDFDPWRAEFPELVSEQQVLFTAETNVVSSERFTLDTEIEELEREHAAAMRQEESLIAQLNIADSQLQIQNSLLQRRLTTRSRSLDAQQASERIKAEIASAQRSALSALRAISEIRRTDLNKSSERLQRWSETVAELSVSIAELGEAESRQIDSLDRLVVRSPVSGWLHELNVSGIGEVLAPGDKVGSIVPSESTLIAEVRVQPDDIGFVETGSSAEITITTFDREVFGVLLGEVVSVSPTTFQVRDQDPYYLARLSLDRSSVKSKYKSADLAPGMVVRAQIRTGEKSVLKYLLKPLVRAWDIAFSER